MSSKFHLSKWKIYFSQFIDKYLKIKNLKGWFVYQASREYFGVESTAFLSSNKFTEKYTLCYGELTVKYVFFISEAIKIAVSFNKFQCCCLCYVAPVREIKTWLFSCLKTSKKKSILSEAILIKVSSGCVQIDYIKKLSKRISASSSKEVKSLIKELLCIHIASQFLPSIS